MHLAVNRLAAAGAYALAANIQLIVSAELPEKSIKALMGSVSESCGKLHITSVQADVAAVPGLTETVITATAIGEAGGFLNRKRPRRTRILSWLVMQAIMVRQSWLLPVRQSWSGILILYFLSPVMEADYTGDTISAVSAVKAAAAAGVRSMYACGEGGVYTAVWELAENAGLGARIQLKEVPLRQETVEICDYFNISHIS